MSGPSLFTLEWWFTVVFLSVALNLVAAYLKPSLDRFGGRISTRWAERNSRRVEEREARIEWASQSDLHYTTFRFRVVTARLRAIGDFVLAFSFITYTLAISDHPGHFTEFGEVVKMGTIRIVWDFFRRVLHLIMALGGPLALLAAIQMQNYAAGLETEAAEAFARRTDRPGD